MDVELQDQNEEKSFNELMLEKLCSTSFSAFFIFFLIFCYFAIIQFYTKYLFEHLQVKPNFDSCVDNSDVDLVYSYVDGNDPIWQQKKSSAEKLYGHPSDPKVDKGRFVNFEEIRYSLRSVEKFAPWARKIFIITDNQTIPYIRSDHPKIVYVDHTTIFPKSALPSFNSNSIEHSILNIPGLSENFIYLNDDLFFSRPQIKHDYFMCNGKPRYYVIRQGWGNVHSRYYNYYQNPKRSDGDTMNYFASLYYTASTFLNRTNVKPFGRNFHSVFPCSLTIMKEARKLFGETINETIHHHFRQYNDIMFQLSSILTCLHEERLCEIYYHGRTSFYAKEINFHTDPNPFSKINASSFLSVCVNSGKKTTDEYRKNAKLWLEEWLPEKSSFEK